MSQFQTFSSADLKTMLRDTTGQDYNETVIIAVQKLLDVIYANNKSNNLVHQRDGVQGCLHSAIYDLYVYQNQSIRNYKVLLHDREITPSEVATLEKMGVITESLLISPFSDELWNVRFDRFI